MKKQSKNKAIAIFEGKQIRRHWDEGKELWYFAIMDVIEALAQTDRPRKYWNDLKTKLKHEGSELSEKIGQLKMQASDGKYYLTDAADTETMLRLIQSIPSPNAGVKTSFLIFKKRPKPITLSSLSVIPAKARGGIKGGCFNLLRA